MQGMSKQTGRQLDGVEHLWQSIEDILTTPKGTRVMRRDYGSDLPYLIDNPYNEETHLDMISATVEAIQTWETRFDPTDVSISHTYENGKAKVEIDVSGDYLPDGTSITLEGIVIS